MKAVELAVSQKFKRVVAEKSQFQQQFSKRARWAATAAVGTIRARTRHPPIGSLMFDAGIEMGYWNQITTSVANGRAKVKSHHLTLVRDVP